MRKLQTSTRVAMPSASENGIETGAGLLVLRTENENGATTMNINEPILYPRIGTIPNLPGLPEEITKAIQYFEQSVHELQAEHADLEKRRLALIGAALQNHRAERVALQLEVAEFMKFMLNVLDQKIALSGQVADAVPGALVALQAKVDRLRPQAVERLEAAGKPASKEREVREDEQYFAAVKARDRVQQTGGTIRQKLCPPERALYRQAERSAASYYETKPNRNRSKSL